MKKIASEGKYNLKVQDARVDGPRLREDIAMIGDDVSAVIAFTGCRVALQSPCATEKSSTTVAPSLSSEASKPCETTRSVLIQRRRRSGIAIGTH